MTLEPDIMRGLARCGVPTPLSKSRPLAVVAVIFAMLIGPGLALAQTHQCFRPPKPEVPEGFYAERGDMEGAGRQVEIYSKAMGAYLNCISTESKDAALEQRQVIEKFNAEIENYNNR
jgi:hypothetical protein